MSFTIICNKCGTAIKIGKIKDGNSNSFIREVFGEKKISLDVRIDVYSHEDVFSIKCTQCNEETSFNC